MVFVTVARCIMTVDPQSSLYSLFDHLIVAASADPSTSCVQSSQKLCCSLLASPTLPDLHFFTLHTDGRHRLHLASCVRLASLPMCVLVCVCVCVQKTGKRDRTRRDRTRKRKLSIIFSFSSSFFFVSLCSVFTASCALFLSYVLRAAGAGCRNNGVAGKKSTTRGVLLSLLRRHHQQHEQTGSRTS